MTRFRLLAILSGLVFVACAMGQDPKPATIVGPETQMGGLELLVREDVQADLALTKQQKDALAQIRKDTAAAMRALSAKGGGSTSELEDLHIDQRAKIGAVLIPEQLARLK